MAIKKHALVLFTKSPQPGRTKTRLTRKFGGPLTDEEAASLYQAMMLDVVNVARQAVQACVEPSAPDGEQYDFIISCSPEEEAAKLRTILHSELCDGQETRYIVDSGSNFDQHLNDAYHQLFDQGYDSVVCIGGDLPTVTPELLCRAFLWLNHLGVNSEKGAMVIAPCQEAGVSLIGLTSNAPMDFEGVFYNASGVSALEAIVSIASSRGIPMGLIETLADVDVQQDLAHAMALINAMSYASRFQPHVVIPEHTLSWIQKTGMVISTPPNEEHDPRGEIDGGN